ncbi:helix-turn-helix domain-containing protein [Kitasatospora sp. NPDC057965]|uniref:helix-turn-helix domain-containing protein n=1 Tax=unclassified Kitasatospora TaxID=2633591 RepID=UPI00367D0553
MAGVFDDGTDGGGTTAENVARRPPAWLNGLVIRYRGYRTPCPRPLKVMLPSARVALLLGWGDPVIVHGDRTGGTDRAHRYAMVAGLRTDPLLAGFPGAGYAIEVEFTPMGAHRCLGLPVHHLTGAVPDPDDVLGPGWTARTTERLAGASRWEDRWAVLDAALASRMADAPVVAPLAAEAWHLLWSRHGALSVGELCRFTGRGNRRLQAVFRESVGIPPQSLARVIRFQYALKYPAGQYRSLAELAALCGYHDQAHMNRDFRALSGHTPGRLLALTRDRRAAPGPRACMSDFFTEMTAGLPGSLPS